MSSSAHAKKTHIQKLKAHCATCAYNAFIVAVLREKPKLVECIYSTNSSTFRFILIFSSFFRLVEDEKLRIERICQLKRRIIDGTSCKCGYNRTFHSLTSHSHSVTISLSPPPLPPPLPHFGFRHLKISIGRFHWSEWFRTLLCAFRFCGQKWLCANFLNFISAHILMVRYLSVFHMPYSS